MMSTIPIPPDPRNIAQTRDAFVKVVATLRGLIELRTSGGRLKATTSAGAPTGSDPDGTIVVDTTNHRLYVRSGGVWKYTALT